MDKVYLVYEGFGNDWLDGNWTEQEIVNGVYPSIELACKHVDEWVKHYEWQNGAELNLNDNRGTATLPAVSCGFHNGDEEYYCYIEEREILNEVNFRAV